MSNCGFIKKFRSSIAKDLKRHHTAAFLVLDTVAENAKRTYDEGDCLLELGEAIITAEECGITKNQFPTALKLLESKGMIEIIHRGRRDKDSKFMTRVNKFIDIENDLKKTFTTRIKPESTDAKWGVKTRINGTIIKLIDSVCYDINLPPPQNPNQNQTRIN